MSNYLIWSNEHRAWWRPGHSGYTNHVSAAGRYNDKEALEICNGANYSWCENTNPQELPVPEHLAMQLKYKRPEDGTA